MFRVAAAIALVSAMAVGASVLAATSPVLFGIWAFNTTLWGAIAFNLRKG